MKKSVLLIAFLFTLTLAAGCKGNPLIETGGKPLVELKISEKATLEGESFTLVYPARWGVEWKKEEGTVTLSTSNNESIVIYEEELGEDCLERTRQLKLTAFKVEEVSEVTPLEMGGRNGVYFEVKAQDQRARYVYFNRDDGKDLFFVILAFWEGDISKAEKIFETLQWK